VLFREEMAGLPRFASSAWLDRLGKANARRHMKLAAHLCSSRVDELLSGKTDFVERLHNEMGFDRVQVNATKANGVKVDFGTDAGAARCVAALRAAFAALPQVEFIIQRNSETRPLWERLLLEPATNMSILFDDSMGLGVSTSKWPAPPTDHTLRFGYAGGLSPANLASKLDTIESAAPGRTLWVDMETSLRTLLKDETDMFDVNKAMACVRCVIECGLEPQSDS